MGPIVATEPAPVAETKTGPAWVALTRRAFGDAKVRTIAFAYLFAGYAFIQPVGYRDAYKTIAAAAGVRAELWQQHRDPALLR